MSKKWVVIDFETASGLDLKKVGSYVYSEHPTTEITALAWRDNAGDAGALDPARLAPEGILLAHVLDPATIFVAHNAPFERAVWRNLMVPRGWSDIPIERWHDTMAVALMKGLPAKLEILARAIKLDNHKDMAGSALAISLSKFNKKTNALDRTPETMEKVLDYCAQDVAVEVEALKYLGNFQGGERKVWELDQRINDYGIRIDDAYVRAAQKIVDQSVPQLVKEFNQITGFNPTQGEKIKGWLHLEGVPVTSLNKETVARLLGEDEDVEILDAPTLEIPDHCRRALKIRGLAAGAAVKKLPAMLACQGADGRARGLLQYHGAGPGRWAGRILQPHNFPRAGVDVGDNQTARPDELVAAIIGGDSNFLRMVYGEPLEAIAAGLRHALVADDDKTFLIGDFAQIEARIVLALAGQYDAVETFVTGDPYCAMAEKIFHHPVTKKEHPEKRQTGKNTILGCGFGMGHVTFRSRYAHKETVEFAKSCIEAYRKDFAPKVPELWYGIERASMRAVWEGGAHHYNGILYQVEGPWLTCRIPSGRKLWYFEPRQERRAMPWDEKDVRPSWSHMTFKAGQWIRRDAYGGLLTENVVQAMARDLLVSNMFLCEREGLPIVLTVHDEVVVESIQSRMSEFEDIMKSRPQWAVDYRIPVAVECMESGRYRK